MDRHLVAYLILAGCLLALAVGLLRARYYSRNQVLKRRRHADEARWAERDRQASEGAPPAS
jgi:hypothetical protein